MASFDWLYVVQQFGNPRLWQAMLLVLGLSALSWLTGVTLGMGLALVRRSRSRALRVLAGAYIWFFRNVPLLVLLVFVYNAPLVLPALRPVLSIPFWTAFIAITLTEVAYTAEIHRGGLVAVGQDQHDAGRALGLSRRQVFAHVVLPQALRVSLPALRNDLISIIKLTSLASVISLPELLYVGQSIYTSNFKVLETLLAVTVFYVLLATTLDLAMQLVERRLDRRARPGALRGAAPREHRTRVARSRREHEGDVAIRVAGLVKTYDGNAVLRGIDLTVHAGEVVALIGPSGSGKTTLIRTLNLLEPIDGGSVTIEGAARSLTRGMRLDGADAARHRRRVGMVFQRFNLFPHRTVMGNLTLAPRLLLDETREVLETQAVGLLRRMGLEAHRDKYPHQLSGGQQQRVAIARALMMRPAVVLFDEPTSALDRELVAEVLDTIRDLAADGLTMVVVSHELGFVEDVADWVVFLDGGVVVEEGIPSTVMRSPGEARTRAFLGHERAEESTRMLSGWTQTP